MFNGGWVSIDLFVQELQAAIEEEANTIRETELSMPGKHLVVLVDNGQRKKPEKTDAWVDKFRRIHLPPRFESVQRISVNGEFKKVTKTDSRWEGTERTSIVCYLEGETDEAGNINR